ncbi:MAG: hypothetical protein V3S69_05450 [Dehalococcoidales bacterium]
MGWVDMGKRVRPEVDGACGGRPRDAFHGGRGGGVAGMDAERDDRS